MHGYIVPLFMDSLLILDSLATS